MDIEAYLRSVRRGLRTLPEGQRQEILEELRSHLVEQSARRGEEAAVMAMGPPHEIAGLFLTERVAKKVYEDRTPWSVLAASYRLAPFSLNGLLTLLFSLIGYVCSLFFLLVALFKPQAWGWWVLPLGLLLAAVTIAITWRLALAGVRQLGRKGARRRSEGDLAGERL